MFSSCLPHPHPKPGTRWLVWACLVGHVHLFVYLTDVSERWTKDDLRGASGTEDPVQSAAINLSHDRLQDCNQEPTHFRPQVEAS